MDLQTVLDHRAQVEAFQVKHRIALLTLLFTDIVGSTQLKQQLGDREGVALIQRHHALVREILSRFKDAEEISTSGDSFFLVFAKPSEAAKFALLLQARLGAIAKATGPPILDRIGIHFGEVVIEDTEGGTKAKDLYGLQVDTCARIMSLAQANQILMTRFVFDNARQVLRGQDVEGVGALSWLNHGPYLLKGVEEPLEVCEVGETGKGPLTPPTSSEKARRHVSDESEPVLAWRPALEQKVPGTQWVLEKKLGEGGFGEVWLGRHETLKERRVFKFCFRADRVRSLKREVTLFRLLKERVGHHPNIVGIQEVFFDEPPFYIVMDYSEATDLRTWSEERGGVGSVPLATRLEIVAQVADALQAAHEAGVIHRDVKPSNILVSQPSTLNTQLSVKLTDFGIGQVVSEEALAGLTRMGFTRTMSPGSSSQTGTHLYMAPELLAGKPASTRSDIYSLGVVLYQLLAADFAHPLTTDWAKAIHDPLLREDLEKCFAGNPAERFASAHELASRIRSLEERRSAWAAREKAVRYRRIARQGAVAGLVAAVFAVLAIYAFRHRDSNPTQGLGSVTASVEAPGTKDLQALDSYNRGKAYFLVNSKKDELTNAVNWFEEAVKLDPNFAQAYTDLASACRLLDVLWEPKSGWELRAWEAVEKAISINTNLAAAYVVRGALFFTPSKAWNGARDVADQQRAIELDPKVQNAHFNLAFVYDHLGFFDEAIEEVNKEQKIAKSPLTPLWLKAYILTAQGKYTNALAILKLLPDGVFPHVRHRAAAIGTCYFYQGQTKKASQFLEELLKTSAEPEDAYLLSILAMVDAKQGDRVKAEARIVKVVAGENRFIDSHHVFYNLGCAYALLGDKKSAMKWLKNSADDGNPCYPMFRDDPNLKNLHEDLAFEEFLHKLEKTYETNRAILPKP